MGRNLNQIIAELPPERQERIETRCQALRQEVKSLRDLRQIMDEAQAVIASGLKIKEPCESEIEMQAGMCLSTLHSYVRASAQLDILDWGRR